MHSLNKFVQKQQQMKTKMMLLYRAALCYNQSEFLSAVPEHRRKYLASLSYPDQKN